MTTFPKHVAIIMDGNGRWAQRRLLPRVAGHHKGVEAARAIVQRCIDLQIPVLTLFAFSSENWHRPVSEVKLLMSLLQNLLADEVHQLHSNKVKLNVIGDVDRLAEPLQHAIVAAQQMTLNNSGLQLNIALNYGGRWDITQAARKLCEQVVAGELNFADVNETTFAKNICLHGLPDPDLLIRTSGEQRISNFLLWQIAYAEVYFTESLWPDFAPADLDLAFEFFAQRQRRFGLVPTGTVQHA